MNLRCGLLDLLFPPKCPFCRRVTDTGVCEACREKLPWVPEEEILREDAGLFRCAAPLYYEGPVRDALLRLKFAGGIGAAEPLGELIAACAAEWLSGAFDCVTWVPVSKKRLKRRGYDQARLLCEAACRLWKAKPLPLLEKTVDNPAQSGIEGGPSARRANVQGVYRAADPGKIRGRRILLIDDILTTGSTLSECVRVLEEAGAENVVCTVLAQVRPSNEQEKKTR